MEPLKDLFSFPNPVNEIAARMVAAMVILVAVSAMITGQSWLLVLLAYGFLARVTTGPTLSPMGQLATRALVPALGGPEKLTPGPPKRFAQTIGLGFSTTALVLHFAVGSAVAVNSVLGVLVFFAHKRNFRLDYGALAPLHIDNISASTQPEDFAGSRRGHGVWLISRPPGPSRERST